MFYLVLAIAGLVWVGLREGTFDLALFVDTKSWWLDALLGLAAGAFLIVAWDVAGRFIPGAKELERRLAELLGNVSTGDAIGLAVLSGFGEELFFRGAVQGSWGLIPATLLFAVLHTGPGKVFRLWTLFAAIAGLAMGGLMLWRGNLLAPVLAHFLVNAVNLSRLSKKSLEVAEDHPAEPAGRS